MNEPLSFIGMEAIPWITIQDFDESPAKEIVKLTMKTSPMTTLEQLLEN